MSNGIYEEIRTRLRSWVLSVVHNAVHIMHCGRRKTMSVTDVILALKSLGTTMYGFDGDTACMRRAASHRTAAPSTAGALQVQQGTLA